MFQKVYRSLWIITDGDTDSWFKRLSANVYNTLKSNSNRNSLLTAYPFGVASSPCLTSLPVTFVQNVKQNWTL